MQLNIKRRFFEQSNLLLLFFDLGFLILNDRIFLINQVNHFFLLDVVLLLHELDFLFKLLNFGLKFFNNFHFIFLGLIHLFFPLDLLFLDFNLFFAAKFLYWSIFFLGQFRNLVLKLLFEEHFFLLKQLLKIFDLLFQEIDFVLLLGALFMHVFKEVSQVVVWFDRSLLFW